MALSHSLIDNPVQRELMLKVMLTPSLGSVPVSLLSLVTDLLQSVRVRLRDLIFTFYLIEINLKFGYRIRKSKVKSGF